jgi:hypothetical protein
MHDCVQRATVERLRCTERLRMMERLMRIECLRTLIRLGASKRPARTWCWRKAQAWLGYGMARYSHVTTDESRGYQATARRRLMAL